MIYLNDVEERIRKVSSLCVSLADFSTLKGRVSPFFKNLSLLLLVLLVNQSQNFNRIVIKTDQL